MTSQLAFSEMISHAARIHRAGAEDSLLEADQTVDKCFGYQVEHLNEQTDYQSNDADNQRCNTHDISPFF